MLFIINTLACTVLFTGTACVVVHTKVYCVCVDVHTKVPDFASPIPIVTQYTKTNIVLYLVPINFAIKVRGARYSTSTSKSQTDTSVHIQYGLWFRIWTQVI